jgi:hypothetical protein
MNRFKYFKITFFSTGAGIITFSIVKGLFDINLSNKNAIGELVLKSVFTGVIVGAFLGLLNMVFNVWPSNSKNKGA